MAQGHVGCGGTPNTPGTFAGNSRHVAAKFEAEAEFVSCAWEENNIIKGPGYDIW